MSLTRDILVGGEHPVHLGIFPNLGLLIISDIPNFSENWSEVRVTQESRTRMDVSTRLLNGHRDADLVESVSSYMTRLVLEHIQSPSVSVNQCSIGPSSSKFTVNLNLKREIMTNNHYVVSIGNELLDMINKLN